MKTNHLLLAAAGAALIFVGLVVGIKHAYGADVSKMPNNIFWMKLNDTDFDFYQTVDNEMKRVASVSCEKVWCRENPWYSWRYYTNERGTVDRESCETIGRITTNVIDLKAFQRLQEGLDLEEFCAQAIKLKNKKK